MKQKLLLVLALHGVALSLAGCATEGKSLALGGAAGAGAGAILGGIADPGKDGQYRTRNVIIGSALGGMAGMVAGAAIHDSNEKSKEEGYKAGKASAPPPQAGAAPTLRPATYKTEWIEGHKIGGNRWVDGHFEYVIDQPAGWEGQ
jgi:hypothetical protein